MDWIKWQIDEVVRWLTLIPHRIRDWWFLYTHPHKALFVIRRIKDGKVMALRCNYETGDVLKGEEREEYEFDHSIAPHLHTGDLHVVYSK